MSDVQLGFEGFSGIIFLLDLASVFLIGFIPAFYFMFLFLRKRNVGLIGNIILSIFAGIIVTTLALYMLLHLFSAIEKINALLGVLFPIFIILLEIIVIYIHNYTSKKREKKVVGKKIRNKN